MKTFRSITILLVFCMSFCFVACDYDPHAGKRPIDQPGTTWVCEEYQMTFTVGEFESSEFVTENGIIHFAFLFGQFGNDAIVYEYGNRENVLFTGLCEFSRNCFTIEVRQNESAEMYFDKFPVKLEFVKVQ